MYTLQSPGLQGQIGAKSSATAQSNIFLGSIKSLALQLRHISEQSEIVSRVDRLFEFASKFQRR